MSNSLKIVTLAALFNLTFEFAFRGVKGILLHPSFVIALFLIYFSYFAIVNDLIKRYRPTNFQLLVIAFAFGLLPMTFLTGVTFGKPLFLGVNVGKILFINIVWWWALQTIVTFYFATRIVKRDWNAPLMGKLGWTLSVGYLIFVHLRNFLTSTTLPRGEFIGYLTVAALFILCLLYLKRNLKTPQQSIYNTEKSWLLDILAFGTVAVFLYLGFVVASNAVSDPISSSFINLKAVGLGTKWTIVVFAGLILHYILKRKQVRT